MKYLITGGTGFIGRNVTKALLENGYEVRVFDNNFRGNSSSLKSIVKHFEFHEGDIRDEESVKKACKDVDGVVHLAAINGTKYFYSMPEIVLDVSTRGMLNVISACLWYGIEDVFLASSSEVYHKPKLVPTPETIEMVIPDSTNPRYSYAGGKIISELLLTHYGNKFFQRAIIFRPHNVYGPEMGWEHVIPQFILRMRRLSNSDDKIIKFPIQGSGDETRSFAFIDDFVAGLLKVIEKGKHMEIYNIGTNEEVSIKKVAENVASYFKKNIITIPGKIAEGGTPRRLPDITKLKGLGYKPKTKLKEGIAITAQWYNENAHKFPALDLP